MESQHQRYEKDADPWRGAGVLPSLTTSGEVGGDVFNIPEFPEKEQGNLQGVKFGGVSLGNTTNKVSAKRFRKYELQKDVIQAVAGMGMRVETCMRALHKEVKLIKHQDGRVSVSGVMTCGSVWLCPVCASRISAERRQELTEAVKRCNFTPVMVTVTVQHQLRDRLSDTLGVLSGAVRTMKGGRWWKSFTDKYGVRAYVTSLEIMYSRANGFHPHKHILFFLQGGVDLDQFAGEFRERYCNSVRARGGYASEYHAVDVRQGDELVGEYVSKWGIVSEVTSSDTKESRGDDSLTMWQLAELSGSEAWAREAFREYARSTFGMRALQYSHGGKAVLGIGKVEGEVESEVDQEETEVLAVIPSGVWGVVHKLHLVGELFWVAETGGALAVYAFLASLTDPGGGGG